MTDPIDLTKFIAEGREACEAATGDEWIADPHDPAGDNTVYVVADKETIIRCDHKGTRDFLIYVKTAFPRALDELEKAQKASKENAALAAVGLVGAVLTLGDEAEAAGTSLEEMDALIQRAEAAEARVRELEGLVYVPGLWRCAKCDLELVTNYMCAESGNLAANNDPQECANGCGPMWRVTERDAGNRLVDRLEQTEGENRNLEEKLVSDGQWQRAAFQLLKEHDLMPSSSELIAARDRADAEET